MTTRLNRMGMLGVIALGCVLMGAGQMPAVEPPAALGPLKALAGKWEGTHETPDGTEKVALEYAVTSAGTAVVEKLFAGSDEEMVSMYHGDGQGVMMTHYCSLGNQPRMRLKKGKKSKVLEFVFVDGTGMKSDKDPHMHALTITLVDKDHLTHDWVFYVNGEKQSVMRFEFTRKK